jgi:hypothetical protein
VIQESLKRLAVGLALILAGTAVGAITLAVLRKPERDVFVKPSPQPTATDTVVRRVVRGLRPTPRPIPAGPVRGYLEPIASALTPADARLLHIFRVKESADVPPQIVTEWVRGPGVDSSGPHWHRREGGVLIWQRVRREGIATTWRVVFGVHWDVRRHLRVIEKDNEGNPVTVETPGVLVRVGPPTHETKDRIGSITGRIFGVQTVDVTEDGHEDVLVTHGFEGTAQSAVYRVISSDRKGTREIFRRQVNEGVLKPVPNGLRIKKAVFGPGCGIHGCEDRFRKTNLRWTGRDWERVSSRVRATSPYALLATTSSGSDVYGPKGQPWGRCPQAAKSLGRRFAGAAEAVETALRVLYESRGRRDSDVGHATTRVKRGGGKVARKTCDGLANRTARVTVNLPHLLSESRSTPVFLVSLREAFL